MSRPYRIQIVAPSGYPEPQATERGIAHLRALGHSVQGTAAAQRRFERFAGTDSERAADINGLATLADLPDIVLAARGGYGAGRLLQALDYGALRARLAGAPIALVGHSDFTALQMALLAQAGLITFAGPMLAGDFGATAPSAFTSEHFWRTVAAPQCTVDGLLRAGGAAPVDLSGTLWGGNLALLASLVGTPYLPAIDAGILFVEDVGERPYRLERLLYQLHLAGILARQQALLLGDFADATPAPYDNGYDLQSVLGQLRQFSRIPVFTGLRFGHIPDKVTLPVGAPARLRSEASGAVTLSAWGYPGIG